ncbi:winged helix-turn-helix transcriptional regulator [Streptomyces sp. NPDC015220]|uniref:winged helix-turn-helix transcriptional regulator n=1 Tax=Streptomyces sp. NPDC015220 TaxID=3364947 RepID=UPI0036FF947F
MPRPARLPDSGGSTDCTARKHAERGAPGGREPVSTAGPDARPEEHDRFEDAYEAARILSGKWVFAVLVHLAEGPRYHNDLARSAGMAENKPLDRALHRLLHVRMVDRTVHTGDGSAPRVRYRLTPRGYSVLPIIDELADWWRATESPDR